MPRTLPWLSVDPSKKPSPAPRPSKKRSSTPDRLVNSELEDASPPPPEPKRKRRIRQPSSSPPPITAPEVVYMNEGLSGDDIYVMVEDEFYSTAQLFTAPLHRAAYDRLKRLHRSRGAETLRNLERAVDGRRVVGTALRIKMEARERAKKRAGSTGAGEESDDDDEYMAVPELKGLMTSSQVLGTKTGMEGMVKAKSNTRAAAGYSQSPHKGQKTKNVFLNLERMVPVEEDETEDENDLDAGLPTTATSCVYKDVDELLNKPRPTIEKTEEPRTKSAGFFKAFAKPTEPDRMEVDEPRKSAVKADAAMSRDTSATPTTNGFTKRGGGGKGSRMSEMLAKRKQGTQTFEPERFIKPEPPAKKTPIKLEPVPSPKPNGRLQTTASPAVRRDKSSEDDASHNEKGVKKEPEEKRKNRRDDIPTFLF